MMPRKMIVLLALVIALIMGIWACGGGDSEPTQTASPIPSQPTSSENQQTAATASTAEEKAIESAEGFFQNPPNFAIDLTDDILTAPTVPSADMEIPQIEVGNLDMNLGDMNLSFDVDIPAIDLPKTTGIVDMPSISTSSMIPSIPTSTTGGDSTPTTPSLDCSMFSAMPDAYYCSMLPASMQQQCEQCKVSGN